MKIQEHGWAGHFICAESCRYRRNTHVSKGKKVIVISSVGCYMSPEKKVDTIGHERLYETMVFVGKQVTPYIEVDVTKQVSLPDSLEWGIFGKSITDLPVNVDLVMDSQHDKIVKWIVKNFDKAYKQGYHSRE